MDPYIWAGHTISHLTETVDYTPRNDWGTTKALRMSGWVALPTVPEPLRDLRDAMVRIKAATGHTPNVLHIGGKRLVNPTLERGIMALTGCTAAEARVEDFWAETRAGQSGMGKEG